MTLSIFLFNVPVHISKSMKMIHLMTYFDLLPQVHVAAGLKFLNSDRIKYEDFPLFFLCKATCTSLIFVFSIRVHCITFTIQYIP